MSKRELCPKCGTEYEPDQSDGVCPACGNPSESDAENVVASIGRVEQDRNLLFCVLAIQLRIISAKDFLDAAAAWAIDPQRRMPDRLADAGAISEDKRKLLDGLVDEAVRQQGGNVSETLDLIGGRESLVQHFADADEDSRNRFTLTRLGLPLDIDSGNLDSLSAVQETPGRYTQMSEYSRGGVGRILLVHDAFLSRDVALKELLPESTSRDASTRGKDSPVRQSGHVLTRFLREARVTGQLEHPSIVPVYELGRRDDGTLYYTMKLVRGRTLARALSESKSLNERLRLLGHFVNLCQAIAYAHSRNVIHRDIKPMNTMIGEFGETVVIDWGLAKIVGRDDIYLDDLEDSVRFFQDDEQAEVKRTKEGAFMGTPEYMSPEQAAGQIGEIDERSDIFSLGIVLYEILTGKTPFHADSISRIVNRIKSEAPTPIEEFEPDCPPELRSICLRAIEKDKKDRYQSAMELAEDLERFQTGAFVKAYGYNFRETVVRYYRRYRDAANIGIAALLGLLMVSVFSYVQILRQKNLAEKAAYDSSTKLAYQYIADRDFDAAFETLNNTPEHLRGWEWSWAVQSARRPWTDTLDETRSFSWTDDGRYVITSADDNVVRVRDAESLSVIHEIETQQFRVRRPVHSADGSTIAVIGNTNNAEIYDVATGTLLRKIESGLPGQLRSAEFSDSGDRLLVMSAGGHSAIFDTQSGDALWEFGNPDFLVQYAAFDQSETWILLNSKNAQSRVYSAETGDLKASFSSPLIAIDNEENIAFLRNGGNVEIRALDTIEQLDSWNVFDDDIELASVSDDGSLLGLSDSSGRTAVIAMDTGESLFRDHLGFPIRSLVFSPEGDYFAAMPMAVSRQFDSQIWHIGSGVRTRVLRGHSKHGIYAVFSPDSSRIITTSFDSVARIWEGLESTRLIALAAFAQPAEQYSFELPSQVNTFSVSNDGSVVLLGFNRGAYEIIDGKTGERIVTLTGEPANGIDHGALAGDGRTAVFLADPFSPAAFDIQELRLKRLYTGHDSAIIGIDAANDADRIVSASSDGFVKVWSSAGDDTFAELQFEQGRISAVAIDRGGTSVCIGLRNGSLIHWRPEQDRIRTVQGRNEEVTKVTFSPDGSEVFALYEDGTLSVWNLDDPSGSRVNELRSGRVGDFGVGENGIFYTNEMGALSIQTWPDLDVYVSADQARLVSVAEHDSETRLFLINSDRKREQLYLASVDGGGDVSPVRRDIASVASPVPAYSILGTGEMEEAIRWALDSPASAMHVVSAHPFLRLGLYGDDRIVAVNGVNVTDEQEFRELLTDALNAGEVNSLTFTIRRNNALYAYSWIHVDVEDVAREVSISPEQRDRMIERTRRQLRESRQELTAIQELWYGTRGIDWKADGLTYGFVVPDRFFSDIVDEFDALGMAPKDVVQQIQGQPIDSLDALDAALSGLEQSAVSIEIRRGAFERLTLQVEVTE